MDTHIVKVLPGGVYPDENYQFVLCRPFEPIQLDEQCGGGVGAVYILAPPEWFSYDSWEIKLACELITLGYPAQIESIAEEFNRYPWDYEMDKFKGSKFPTMEFVYNRALSFAKSSVKAGTIKEHDTQANWIEWAQGKGYKVAHLMPADTPAGSVEEDTSPSGDSNKPISTANQVYWRAVLHSNINKIDEHGKANVREIIKYLRGLNDKRLPNEGTLDALIWIDDMGNKQCVDKKTVSNATSTARQLP